MLVEAEVGCGAPEIASALHARSRPRHPLLMSDCGVDEPLGIEQRLFGTVARAGEVNELEDVTATAAVVQAGAGTLFVDNIDELPAAAQRRLVRVLRDGEVRVAGRAIRTGFRLIAATSRDLSNEAREGRFREDLWRRLAKCRITIAALRRRPADLPQILDSLVHEAANGTGRITFTPQALAVLASLPWTRNFDELREVVASLSKGQPGDVTAEQVLSHVSLRGQFGRMDLTVSLREARRQFERQYIGAVLEHHRWSMSEAARTLGMERANLYRKARQLGITRGARESWTVPS